MFKWQTLCELSRKLFKGHTVMYWPLEMLQKHILSKGMIGWDGLWTEWLNSDHSEFKLLSVVTWAAAAAS